MNAYKNSKWNHLILSGISLVRTYLTNSGVVYSNGDVGEKEKDLDVEGLMRQGVICELRPHKKGFFISVLFIKQEKKGKPRIRKVMGFKK